jgi:NADH dehydrogenase [ubiquinone] 1 alpha subcomplex assembly factor 1
MKLIVFIYILSVMQQGSTSNIFNYKDSNNNSNWYTINDGVMGGLSEGAISINEVGIVTFKGYVTTDNNGGFSSARYVFNKKHVSIFNHVVLKVKGDGKSYQFRIKENSSQRYSYITTFKTSGEWETIKIPLSSFYPSFRGNRLDKINYSGNLMEEIAILIGNNTKESFKLEIKKIYLE